MTQNGYNEFSWEELVQAGYAPVAEPTAVSANRAWWDDNAQDYLAEHGGFLGDDDFVWCPENVRESSAHLLGDVVGKDVLEIGCGAAQCARWVSAHGGRVVATDLSRRMLQALPKTDLPVSFVQCDARRLPMASHSFDAAFSAYGALPFVADIASVHQEVFRVLRPGGRWVFSVTHPIRWAFPDSPAEQGLTVNRSYFDRTPYRECDPHGDVRYVEFHHTIGDQLRALADAGFAVDDLVEPEWPDDLDESWGGWSPLRGKKIPGTTIWRTHKPAAI